MISTDVKRTLAGLVCIAIPLALVIASGITFGWWAVYGAFWVLMGLAVLVWIGGLLLVLANEIGSIFFKDPPKSALQKAMEYDQLELPFD